MDKQILIGTSGWSYPHWAGKFFPKKMKSYENLNFYSRFYNTVENNSSFYHLSRASTFSKWFNSTPEDFIFSLKLNRLFTHENELRLDDILEVKLDELFQNLQELKPKLGCMLIQTPPSLKYDLGRLDNFIKTIISISNKHSHKPDFAIEFRNKHWFNNEVYFLLRKYNIAWCIGQSSRYPWDKIVTADFMYIRFHGPKELFASPYSNEGLNSWWEYITNVQGIKKVYIYFNNDFHGYAIDNSRYLQQLSGTICAEPFPNLQTLGF